VFPNRFWSATDLAVQMDNLHQTGARTLLDFARVWDRLAFNQGMFVGPEDTFSPALWIPLPILLIVRWKSFPERVLLLVALAYLCVWFFYSPSGRYLLPVLPLLCLGMGATLMALTTRLRVPALVLAALLALPGAQYAIARTQARGLPPVTPDARQ